MLLKIEILSCFSDEDTWRRQSTLPTAFLVCIPQVSTAWIQTRTSWTYTTATAVGSGSSSWDPTPAGGCKEWTDVLWFGSLQMDKSEPAKREQTPRSPLFLSHSPSEQRGTRRQMGEADPWRFCQEQSLKTVHNHINMHQPPAPLFAFFFHPSLHHSSPPFPQCCGAAGKKKPLTVTHYFQQRTWRMENRGELWASRWGCRAPLPTGASLYSQASQRVSRCGLRSSVSCANVKLLQDAAHQYSNILYSNMTFNNIYS